MLCSLARLDGQALGVQVPEGLSVVGYDGIPLAQWSGPALTTVHQPLVEMAEEAARMPLRLRRVPERRPRTDRSDARPDARLDARPDGRVDQAETRIEFGTRLGPVRNSTPVVKPATE